MATISKDDINAQILRLLYTIEHEFGDIGKVSPEDLGRLAGFLETTLSIYENEVSPSRPRTNAEKISRVMNEYKSGDLFDDHDVAEKARLGVGRVRAYLRRNMGKFGIEYDAVTRRYTKEISADHVERAAAAYAEKLGRR